MFPKIRGTILGVPIIRTISFRNITSDLDFKAFRLEVEDLLRRGTSGTGGLQDWQTMPLVIFPQFPFHFPIYFPFDSPL